MGLLVQVHAAELSGCCSWIAWFLLIFNSGMWCCRNNSDQTSWKFNLEKYMLALKKKKNKIHHTTNSSHPHRRTEEQCHLMTVTVIEQITSDLWSTMVRTSILFSSGILIKADVPQWKLESLLKSCLGAEDTSLTTRLFYKRICKVHEFSHLNSQVLNQTPAMGGMWHPFCWVVHQYRRDSARL